MKILLSVIGVFMLGAILYGIVRIQSRNGELAAHITDLKNQLATLEAENVQLDEDVRYYSYPENLEKEARARLNLKAPGETLVIIPSKTQEPSIQEETTTENAEESESFWTKLKKFFKKE